MLYLPLKLFFGQAFIMIIQKTYIRRHDGHEHVESMKTKNIVKPATYDGKGPWLDYKSHFDACSEINHWSSLRLMGLACFILSRMSPSINESINCSLAKVSRTSFGVVG
jgi:hypothetical protein